MLFLIAFAIALAFVYFCDKPLKKHPVAFYVSAAVLTAAVIVIAQLDRNGAIDINSEFVNKYLLGIFTKGALGGAFWIVVMWAGALPVGSAPIKKIMPIRGELSILSAELILAHVVTYGVQYISDLVNDKAGSGDAFRDFIIIITAAAIMVLIMIPLTIMSFKTVRKKMNPKMWKKIQRAAYVFYALIYIHIMVLYIPKAQKGKEGYFLSVIVYSIVFIGYAVCRLRKVYIAKKKPVSRAVPNAICTCAFAVPVVLCGFLSRSTGSNEVIKASKDKPATFTFEATAPAGSNSAKSEDLQVSTAENKTEVTTSEAAEKTTASGTEPTSVAETTEADEITSTEPEETTEAPAEQQRAETEPVQTQPAQTEPPQPVTEATEPAPVYKYKNGTFDGTAEGYSGSVHVSITIENDYITAFSAYADEDDTEYFSDAMQYVIPQIQQSASADGIDAQCGATYSGKGIIEASREALSKALN